MIKTIKIDYTKMRKNKLTNHGKITICPKCGRKGAFRRRDPLDHDEYTHHTKLNQFAGMEYLSTDSGDYCIIKD